MAVILNDGNGKVRLNQCEVMFEGGQMEDYIELMKASIEEEEINNIKNHT